MSEREARLEAQIANVRQLDTLVTAIRGIAAGRTHDTRARLGAVREYERAVAGALAEVLALCPEPAATREGAPRGKTLVLVCAEQGFAGAFSDAVFDAAGADVTQARLFVIGRRGIRLARRKGLAIAWSAPLMARADMVGPLADALGHALTEGLAHGDVGHVDILFTVSRGGRFAVKRRGLLPLDLSRFADPHRSTPSLMNLDPSRLIQGLATEYLDAELRAALLQGFAAENLVRLSAMTRAHDHIAEQLEGLCRAQRSARQESITAEILEVGRRSSRTMESDRRREPARP